ncbi:MAG: cation-transporting P-type ATPase [Thiohalocapsa sp.]|nr:cation-transporting P-type ATPase [Thiohalocapsa sp.]
MHDRVRGRMRLRIEALYRNPQLGRYLADRLEGAAEIYEVRVSELSATLLLRYSKDADRESLLAALADLLDVPDIDAVSEAARATGTRTAAKGRPPPLPGLRAIRSLLRNDKARTSSHPVVHAEAPNAADNWHALPPPAVLKTLGSSERGLEAAEARRRLLRYGLNTLTTVESRPPLTIVLEQFLTLPVGLLAVSAGVSVVTGGAADAAVIGVVVLINATIGYVTERKADLTIQGLAAMAPQHARVVRDSIDLELEVSQLVPGDVMHLAPGTYVGADMRLLESVHLTLDESALTGESLPVAKDAAVVLPPELALAERRNLAYRGTLVTGGSGRGVVVATAEHTQLGRIQALAAGVATPDTPMQRQLGKLGGQLGVLSAAVCGGVFLVGMLRGIGGLEMLRSAVSLAVAAVPEGLPTVATTTLALGIKQMRRHQVAVRHLDAIETLGSVQVFCLDKTGTLTLNRMSAVTAVVGRTPFELAELRSRGSNSDLPARERDGLRLMLTVLALCNELEVDGDGRRSGSPTEQALIELVERCGLDPDRIRGEHALLEMHQRAEQRPLLSTLHAWRDGRQLVAVKGSPGALLDRCDWLLAPDAALAAADRDAVLALNDALACKAQRVLGVAYKLIPADEPFEARGLIWLGLIGMTDPLRPDMRRLMAMYHRAGIKTVMITGDQSATAQAVAEQLGLAGDRPLKILDAGSLDKLDPQLLAALVPDVDVFARVSPAHKLRIVQAYQRGGRVVAMTGDGINDGPALKAADIGVAMGGSGTDVARSVADVVLEDDNLHTMEVAVSQGRSIYANIRKTIHFLLATNFSEIALMMAGIGLGTRLPLSPMQLLWINLLSDIVPGLALAVEPAEPDVMARPPRDPDEPIVTGRALLRMGRESMVITGGALASLGYGLWRYGPGAVSGTLAFQTLTTAQLLHALGCRSEERVLWGERRPANPYLSAAVGGALGLQMSTLAVPALRRLLGTSRLGPVDLGVVVVTACVPLLVNEALKPAEAMRRNPSENPP